MNDVSTLLVAARDGQMDAANRIFELLYGELRSLAHGQLRRNDRAPLSTTTLINESYLKLVASGGLKAGDRQHFLAYASTVMRSVIVDFARAQLAEKRGAGQAAVTLNTDLANSFTSTNENVLYINDALTKLGQVDERLAKIVEMRYFAGLTENETAEALGLSTRTVQREWEKARMYLAAELKA